MPPSGFSQQAMNGLLTFVRSAYENTLSKYEGRNLSEESVLKDSMHYLDSLVEKSTVATLDGTVSFDGINGLKQFVQMNYKDLITEIYQGKKQEGKAIEAEITHISEYLKNFKIWFYYFIKEVIFIY